MTKSLEEKVIRNEEVKQPKSDLHKKALVMGGGIAGIRAALDIAKHGYKTYLIEKKESLGGRAYKLSVTFPTSHCGICCIHDCKNCVLVPKIFDVCSNRNIDVFTSAEVKEIEGHIGNYNVKIEDKEGYISEVNVGTIIIATDRGPVYAFNSSDGSLIAWKYLGEDEKIHPLYRLLNIDDPGFFSTTNTPCVKGNRI